ncbi:hypothetical protein ACI3PL_33095, partial [Lacticaseibacillus paracasei]
VQLVDEPHADTFVRNGIILPTNKIHGLYRLGRVIKCGSEAKYAKEGEFIRFPQGVGSTFKQIVDGYKTWLVREDSV